MNAISVGIEHRIAALERQNRRMRTWCGVMGVIAAAPRLLGAQSGQPDVVRTTRLDAIPSSA